VRPREAYLENGQPPPAQEPAACELGQRPEEQGVETLLWAAKVEKSRVSFALPQWGQQALEAREASNSSKLFSQLLQVYSYMGISGVLTCREYTAWAGADQWRVTGRLRNGWGRVFFVGGKGYFTPGQFFC
jgi:hypothetical protein